MPGYEDRGLDLGAEDTARIAEFQAEQGLNPEDVLRAAMTGSVTSTGEYGMVLKDGTDYPFLPAERIQQMRTEIADTAGMTAVGRVEYIIARRVTRGILAPAPTEQELAADQRFIDTGEM